ESPARRRATCLRAAIAILKKPTVACIRQVLIMKTRLHCIVLVAFAASLFAIQADAQTNQPIKLWPDAAPGAIGQEPADVPTITPYLPPRERATGAAVVVCPGGGYQMLADHEGRPVAEWLNSIG